MKAYSYAAVLLLVLHARVSQSASVSLLHPGSQGDGSKVEAVSRQLSSILLATQTGLARAEAHHKKAVESARSEVDRLLASETAALGALVRRYSANLTQSEGRFDTAIKEAKAAAKAAAEQATADNAIQFPSGDGVLRLRAQVAAAERSLWRSKRQHARSVREAQRNAEDMLDGGSSKLSLLVGDLSPLMEGAKRQLEAAAVDSSDVPKSLANISANKTSGNLTAVAVELQRAQLSNQREVTMAEKDFRALLQKAELSVMEKWKRIGDGLHKAQLEESAQLHHKPQSKALRSTR
mmetsp:Transcript_30402/g.66603  ORF Transcript_30402/g.66603 Transcript_30402/m.66603 type:complete len:294 (+) Transcript_30402:33-914(+)